MSGDVIRNPAPEGPAKFSPPIGPEQFGPMGSPGMPAFARVSEITALFGFKRTRVYELLATGTLDAKKDGRAVLVNVESVLRFISTLPKANIRLPKTLARQIATNDAPPEITGPARFVSGWFDDCESSRQVTAILQRDPRRRDSWFSIEDRKMPLPTATATARQKQRHAAINFLAIRTPSEAARALLANPHVTDPADLTFLRNIPARLGPLTPQTYERLVRIASPLMSGST